MELDRLDDLLRPVALVLLDRRLDERLLDDRWSSDWASSSVDTSESLASSADGHGDDKMDNG